jgi:hypothetical protein
LQILADPRRAGENPALMAFTTAARLLAEVKGRVNLKTRASLHMRVFGAVTSNPETKP